MKLKIPVRIRIIVAASVLVFLAVSIFLDRKNSPMLEGINETIHKELTSADYVSNLTGTVSDITEIERHGDSFEGQPAYRIVEKITASKGTYTAYINVVRRNNQWQIFDLVITDSSEKAFQLIQYGQLKK